MFTEMQENKCFFLDAITHLYKSHVCLSVASVGPTVGVGPVLFPNNQKSSDNEAVASDVPPRLLFRCGPSVHHTLVKFLTHHTTRKAILGQVCEHFAITHLISKLCIFRCVLASL